MALNAEDIAEIKKTWAIPVATPTDSGAAILIRFFTKYPSNLEKFPFRDVPIAELHVSTWICVYMYIRYVIGYFRSLKFLFAKKHEVSVFALKNYST